jgi:hypothetical protein
MRRDFWRSDDIDGFYKQRGQGRDPERANIRGGGG